MDLIGNKRGKLQQDPCKCGSESDIFQRVPISNNWPSPLTPKHHNRKHSYHAGVLHLWKVRPDYLICKKCLSRNLLFFTTSLQIYQKLCHFKNLCLKNKEMIKSRKSRMTGTFWNAPFHLIFLQTLGVPTWWARMSVNPSLGKSPWQKLLSQATAVDPFERHKLHDHPQIFDQAS